MLSVLCLLASASGLVLTSVSSRTSTISMGLAVGQQMPASVLRKAGVANKKAVLFFYGADDAPSCSKELSSFEDALSSFKAVDVSVVGVRNEAGVKGYEGRVKVVIDEDEDMRTACKIQPDLFGLLGGRETYVVDAKGVIVGTHRSQFDPTSHVTESLESIKSFPKSPFDVDFKQLAGILGVNVY